MLLMFLSFCLRKRSPEAEKLMIGETNLVSIKILVDDTL